MAMRSTDAGGLRVSAILGSVLAAPREQVLAVLSGALGPVVDHQTAIMATGACARAPVKMSGSALPGVTADAILDLGRRVADPQHPWSGECSLGGISRNVIVARSGEPSAGGAVLLLVRDVAAPLDQVVLDELAETWATVSIALADRMASGAGTSVESSASAARERAAALARAREHHGADVAAVLVALRSAKLDDTAARAAALQLATDAAVGLLRTNDTEAGLTTVGSSAAWDSMMHSLHPLFTYGTADLDAHVVGQDVAIPLDIAHLVGSTTRAVVMGMLTDPTVSRIRVHWDLDRDEIHVAVRDDGSQAWTAHDVADVDLQLSPHGTTARIDSTPQWGTTITFTVALGKRDRAHVPSTDMTSRESEVLGGIAAGLRNRDIATSMSISEHTVKFHVRRLLQKFEVTSRGELAAAAHGMRP